MRALVPMVLAVAHLAAQDQTPVFRSGVEVMEVDVTVVDAKGTPVRDLRAPEFTVTIDGQPRRVVSAEFISDRGAPTQPAAPRDQYVSNNSDRRAGRYVMLAIDRNNIDTPTLRASIAPIKRFVGSLGPDDYIAFVTLPPPGPTVDFTTNHGLVVEAVSRVVGTDDPLMTRFNVSNYEAVVFENRSNPIVVQRMLARECGDTDPNTLSNCDRDVEQEAVALASHIRQVTSQSVSSLSGLLKSLRDVEGAKSLIILSQGLMLDGAQSEATALAVLAAEARVDVNVLLFDAPVNSASQARMSETVAQDRELREAGLEAFASRSRGTLFRVVASPQSAFDRLRSEISTHYLLAVEPIEKDRDGRPHQIRVQVGRSGVQVRARRQVQYAVRTTPNSRSRDVLMGRVLRSPAPNVELPMRLSSYVYRDAAPGTVKVVLAAEIDPGTLDKGLDLAVGFVIFDRVGSVVASGQEQKIYSANTDLPIRYELTIPVPPGSYRVRLAAIDLEGKRGSVEREVDAFRMEGQAFALGDMMLAPMRELKSGDLRPPVVLRVSDGALGTYTELYTNAPGSLDATTVVFEVADTADGPTLQSSAAEAREHPDGTMRQVIGLIPVSALPPGRYIARAVVSSAGKTVGKLTRPFEVLPAARTTALPAGAAKAAASAVAPSVVSGPMVGVRPTVFKREDVLKAEMLRAVYDAIDKNHPAAKGALTRARSGKLEGTALMALDAGDQSAGSLLHGLELLSKGQLDPAANQFAVALRNAPDAPIASFLLGACFAAAGKDREAVSAWERARAAKLDLPAMPMLLADGWLRLGQPARALEFLRAALDRDPRNDDIRKNLAIVQSHVGLHEEAYPTIAPFLESHPSDVDALLVALHSLYQVHAEGKTIGSAEQDKAQAAAYARAYAAAKGPLAPLVEKWAEFLSR